MVVNEARTWLGTPYASNGDIKGAGVDCGMLLVRVWVDLGLIESFDPRPYPAQWALHQRSERYLESILRFAVEVPGPPKPGDVVVFKFGHCWAHGGIVTDWPMIIHANPSLDPRSPCRYDDCFRNSDLAKRTPRFFSYWAKRSVEGAR